MTQPDRRTPQSPAALLPAHGVNRPYRWTKLGLAVVLLVTGVVRCPCGAWHAPLVGGVAGAMLYALVARDFPGFRLTRRTSRLSRQQTRVSPQQFPLSLRVPRSRLPAGRRIWEMALNAAIDEVVWRGWLTSPSVPSAPYPYLMVASPALFALAHLPRQGLRGVATHLVSGSVFTVAVVWWGLTAALSAHLSYNLWVYAARRAQVEMPEGRSWGGLEPQSPTRGWES